MGGVLKRRAQILGGVLVFFFGFGLFTVAVTFELPALAFSLFSCSVALFVFFATGRLLWELRAGTRREILFMRTLSRLREAVALQDGERVTLAVVEGDREMEREVALQDANPWSLLRFWKLPPRYGEDWDETPEDSLDHARGNGK